MTNPLPRPLRLGIIGVGGIAQSSHLPSLALLRQRGWPVSVVGVADPDEKRIASALRLLAPSQAANAATCRTYSDGAELLDAGDINAVLLLTPPAQTASLLETALLRGIPALAEKPGATNAQILTRLVEVEKAALNPLVRIAYNRHCLPRTASFVAQLNEMRQRTPAHVLHIEARLWRTRRDAPIFYDDTMVHALDFLLWCAGPLVVEQVQWWPAPTAGGLQAGLRVALRSENKSSLSALTAHLDVRPAVGRDVESYEGLGNREACSLFYEVNGNGKDADGLTERGFLPQLAHFLQIAAGDTNAGAMLSTITQAHETMRLKEKILSSLADH